MEDTPETRIARRAYELWEKAGRPEGKDQEFHYQAEKELLNEEALDRRRCGLTR